MTRLVKAYLVANVKRAAEHKVAKKIRKMKEVTEALVTYGLWGLIARIEAVTLGHLESHHRHTANRRNRADQHAHRLLKTSKNTF